MKSPPTELQSLETSLREPVKLVAVLELCSQGVLFVEDGNHGEYRPLADEFTDHGTPFVRPDDLKDGRVDFLHCDQINDRALARIRKGKGRGGDILFTHRATVGRMARTMIDDPPFVTNPGVTVWRSLAPTVLDPLFLYFFMQTPAFMNQVWAEAGNTDTFPYVSLTQQRSLWLAIPSIAKQQAIASILGALDDKIDLNRRMSETLETMARAVFKDWFVDFGPTRAKLEGGAPYIAPEVWALFPDRLDDEGRPKGGGK
jgi:type I restriction enzyme S subunit